MSRTPSEIKSDLENQDLSMDPDGLLDIPEEIEGGESDAEAAERLRRDAADVPDGPDLRRDVQKAVDAIKPRR